MTRVLPPCALAALCASIALGCAKKDAPEPGGGEAPAAGGGDGRPVLGVRTEGDKQEAAHRLRQVGLALHNYEASHGTFPAGVVGPKGQLGLSWRVAILPYFEGPDLHGLYKEFKLAEPWDSEHNKKLVGKMPKVYEPPGAILAFGKTYLRSFAGPSAFIPGAPAGPKGAPVFNPWANQPPGSPARGRNIAGITDGTSNTLMVFEVAWTGLERSPGSLRAWPRGCNWTSDDNGSKNVANAMRTVKYNGGGNYNDVSMGSNHTGGCNVGLGDGSVRYLRESIDLNRVLLPLASRAGGEIVSDN